ncbi:MAG: hypothetical protein ACK5XE_10540 [Burkholderiales bacterium]
MIIRNKNVFLLLVDGCQYGAFDNFSEATIVGGFLSYRGSIRIEARAKNGDLIHGATWSADKNEWTPDSLKYF